MQLHERQSSVIICLCMCVCQCMYACIDHVWREEGLLFPVSLCMLLSFVSLCVCAYVYSAIFPVYGCAPFGRGRPPRLRVN